MKAKPTNNPQFERLAAMGEPTAAELRAALQDYRLHAEACARVGCLAEPFARFFAEWRDARHLPDVETPAVVDRLAPSLDYSRQFWGARGFDIDDGRTAK